MILSARPRVLVIDADSRHQQRIAQYLSARYQVIATNTLTEGFAMLRDYEPTAVLMELDRINGDAFAWIRQVRGDLRNQRLVIACVTERGGVRDKVAGFQAGADDFVVKPVNPETFLARVTLLIRIRRM